jgi:hypothetical protein
MALPVNATMQQRIDWHDAFSRALQYGYSRAESRAIADKTLEPKTPSRSRISPARRHGTNKHHRATLSQASIDRARRFR